MAKKRKVTKRPSARMSGRQAMSIATSQRKTVEQRVAAMVAAPLAVCESEKDLQSMLKILSDRSEPQAVRLAALQSLGAAAFSVSSFASRRTDYIATLRKVVDDPDLELRQRVLGILMREQDGYAQKKLLEGLKNPTKALLSPEKALQLLSYDIHAEAYSAARGHSQEAAERRGKTRGAPASRGRRQSSADFREGAT